MDEKFLDVELLDTTLRDGVQAMGVHLSLKDKVSIALRLDELGVAYIEGGWPASNPKDMEFFRRIKEHGLSNAEIAVFGITRRKGVNARQDRNLNALLEAEADAAVIVGKSWDLHVAGVLRCSLPENLNLIHDSIAFLKEHGLKTLFDAEHFFDGFKRNPTYAIKTLEAAQEAKADTLILCDTNGGSLPHEIFEAVAAVRRLMPDAKLGIHAHNDAGCAVANSLAAVRAGARHVQVTVCGLGERVGNADLCQLAPALELKMGLRCLRASRPEPERLRPLKSLADYVAELAGFQLSPYQPYVGKCAFAHKAGLHADGILKAREAYEHIEPGLVGNERLLSVSEVAGKANVVFLASRFGIALSKGDPAIEQVLSVIKRLGAEDFILENADGTMFLLLIKSVGGYRETFKLTGWKVVSNGDGETEAEARVELRAGEVVRRGKAAGVGPVHALDLALKRALGRSFPGVEAVRLVNYKVAVVGRPSDTASRVRVFAEFSDGESGWTTTYTSTNILKASVEALADGYDCYLQRQRLRWKGQPGGAKPP